MITVGVDAHRRIHVAVALDAGGRELSHWQGRNDAAGWRRFSDWLDGLGPERCVGIEGAWGYGRRLAQHLVERHERVYEVNARWTAGGRARARTPGKSDRLDARAVAVCVHQEGPRLPRVAMDDETSILDLLSIERERTLTETTRLRNQLHALLLQLDPTYKQTLQSLKTKAAVHALREYAAPDDHPLSVERAAAVRRHADRLALAVAHVADLTARIRTRAAERFAPLTEICGVNLLTAGALAGILGPGDRFASDAALAAYAGVAPLEASSAGGTRHRLNRGGNRRLNAICYRIVLTQAHYSPEARAYLQRRRHEGKTQREAMRALKRYVVRAIWQRWAECRLTPSAAYARAVV